MVDLGSRGCGLDALACEGKSDGVQSAVRLNSPYTVDMRDVAFGDGTTLAGNAQSSRRSELRYGRVSRMR